MVGLEVLSQLATSALQWATLGILGYIVTMVRKIWNDAKLTQKTSKVLLRGSLVRRYKTWSEGRYVKVDDLDEWLSDYDLYMSIAGNNGFVGHIHDELLALANEPPKDKEES